MNDLERWLPIPGFEGRYEVSDLGRVKSLARTESYNRELNNGVRDDVVRSKCEKILCASVGSNGYMTVRLLGKTYTVHALVLTAFVGPRPPDHAGCHGDADKRNNSLANLRWDTYAANNAERQMEPLSRVDGKYVKRSHPTCG